jgi:hypothetical protein
MAYGAGQEHRQRQDRPQEKLFRQPGPLHFNPIGFEPADAGRRRQVGYLSPIKVRQILDTSPCVLGMEGIPGRARLCEPPDWTPERIRRQAVAIGRHTSALIEIILREPTHHRAGLPRLCRPAA